MFSSNAEYSIIRKSEAILSKVLDQTVNGEQWNVIAAKVILYPGDRVQLVCSESQGSCVADALLLESSARYNDGSYVNEIVLDPMDGIILSNGKTCTK